MGAEWRIVIIMTLSQSTSILEGKPTVTAVKPQVLVTNDDGADSPLLVPLLWELSKLAELCPVVPAAECSWTSKSMSRFEPLVLAEIECGGFPVQTLTGKPADCANIGIHNLCPEKPAPSHFRHQYGRQLRPRFYAKFWHDRGGGRGLSRRGAVRGFFAGTARVGFCPLAAVAAARSRARRANRGGGGCHCRYCRRDIAWGVARWCRHDRGEHAR